VRPTFVVREQPLVRERLDLSEGLEDLGVQDFLAIVTLDRARLLYDRPRIAGTNDLANAAGRTRTKRLA
jgi:hypothetical protein